MDGWMDGCVRACVLAWIDGWVNIVQRQASFVCVRVR